MNRGLRAILTTLVLAAAMHAQQQVTVSG